MNPMLSIMLAIGTASGVGPILAQEKAAPPCRIAVVNIGTVFSRYEKALVFKSQLQTAIAPFKAKADRWRKETIEFQRAIASDSPSSEKKRSLEKAILERKRLMEDMDREVRDLIGKTQEDQLVALWKEVMGAAKKYAESKQFTMVLGYGDPTDRKALDTFPNINRKMQGMDTGGIVPLYVHPSCDITEPLTRALNDSYRKWKRDLAETR